MTNTSIPLFIFFVVHVCISAEHLPPYIEPCRRDDPDFSKCVEDHANAAIPHLIRGDEEYKFPPLDPMIIPEAVIDDGHNFKLKMSDVSVYGFDTLRVTDVKSNYSTLKTNHVFRMERLSLVGNYEVEGKIISQPISGKGKANVTLIRPVFYLTWNMGTTFKDGVKYLTLEEATSTYDVERVIYKIDNLFNGDQKLGDDANKFLNENWRALHDEFGEVFSHVLMKNIRANSLIVMESVPFDEIFL